MTRRAFFLSPFLALPLARIHKTLWKPDRVTLRTSIPGIVMEHKIGDTIRVILPARFVVRDGEAFVPATRTGLGLARTT